MNMDASKTSDDFRNEPLRAWLAALSQTLWRTSPRHVLNATVLLQRSEFAWPFGSYCKRIGLFDRPISCNGPTLGILASSSFFYCASALRRGCEGSSSYVLSFPLSEFLLYYYCRPPSRSRLGELGAVQQCAVRCLVIFSGCLVVPCQRVTESTFRRGVC